MLNSLYGQSIGIYSPIHIDSGATLALHDTAIHFNDGIIQTTSIQPGQVTLFGTIEHTNANDDSHIAAPVQSTASSNFIFPLGNTGIYQPLAIDQGRGTPLRVQFHFNAPPLAPLPLEIEQLSPNFYWTTMGEEVAHVQLSWNLFSQLDAWVDDLSTLRLLGYTGSSWEMIPAQLTPFALSSDNPTSLSEGAIRSEGKVDFSRYTALSLGVVAFDTALNISQAITPNGDGINDVWFIENIERYPQASIRVYNRWGTQVFYQASHYKNDWGGTFEDKNKPLPPAPYYYRIDLDNNGKMEHEGWLYINH